MLPPVRALQPLLSKFVEVNPDFDTSNILSMLAGMQRYRPRSGAQKPALIAAAAGCCALGFAFPQQAAAQDVPIGQLDLKVEEQDSAPVLEESESDSLRVATFDANLTRSAPGDLLEDLSAPGAQDATDVADMVQQVRPDVLVLTGVDVDAGYDLVEAFNTNYLAVGGDEAGITYPYSYTAPSNAGVESGADLDRDGTIGGPGDALGYGEFPGQASMLVYSKYPIDEGAVRDFTSLSWDKMPNNSIPDDVSDLERDILPLASVAHWDIPVDVDGETVHILAASGADASETPYGEARNQDQIRFWQDYLDHDTDYIVDHRGDSGPLDDDAQFVLAGSLKADPHGNGPADSTAISELLEHEEITDPQPARTLASSALRTGTLPNTPQFRYHTAPDPEERDETYRSDYVLVDSELNVTDSGVLETAVQRDDAYRGFFGMQPENNSNHLVWADADLGD